MWIGPKHVVSASMLRIFKQVLDSTADRIQKWSDIEAAFQQTCMQDDL